MRDKSPSTQDIIVMNVARTFTSCSISKNHKPVITHDNDKLFQFITIICEEIPAYVTTTQTKYLSCQHTSLPKSSLYI